MKPAKLTMRAYVYVYVFTFSCSSHIRRDSKSWYKTLTDRPCLAISREHGSLNKKTVTTFEDSAFNFSVRDSCVARVLSRAGRARARSARAKALRAGSCRARQDACGTECPAETHVSHGEDNFRVDE